LLVCCVARKPTGSTESVLSVRRLMCWTRPSTTAEDGAAALNGLLMTAPMLLWQSRDVLQAAEDALASLDDDAFLAMLPALKLSLTQLNPHETDRLASEVVALLGLDGGALRGGASRFSRRAGCADRLTVGDCCLAAIQNGSLANVSAVLTRGVTARSIIFMAVNTVNVASGPKAVGRAPLGWNRRR